MTNLFVHHYRVFLQGESSTYDVTLISGEESQFRKMMILYKSYFGIDIVQDWVEISKEVTLLDSISINNLLRKDT